MPFYRTGVLQDAWIRWEAVVEASSPEEAAEMAYDAWKGRRKDVKLIEGDVTGFYNANMLDPEDVEEITEEEYKEELNDQT